MNEHDNALPSGGPVESTQKPEITREIEPQYRKLLAAVFCFCVFTAYSTLWRRPAAGLTAAGFGLYVLFYLWKGPKARAGRSNRGLVLA